MSDLGNVIAPQKWHLRMTEDIDREAFPLGHARKVNPSGRQVCCSTCHTCLEDTRVVLDGELWCDVCAEYR